MQEIPERRNRDTEFHHLRMEVEALKQNISEMRADIKDLVSAWNTARGVTSFVKWASAMIISSGVIVALVKGSIRFV